MNPKQMIRLYHGSAIYAEFPEHTNWFIPELVKNLNKVLKAVDAHACRLTLKNYLEEFIELDISDDQAQYTITIRYDDFVFRFDPFIVEFIKKINTHLIHRFNGYGITPLRPVISENQAYALSNLFFAFASRLDVLNGLPGYSILGNNSDYIPLIPEKAQTILHIPMPVPFEQLDLKHKSKDYDSNHHLPVYPDEHLTKYLHDEIELVLKLNPDNKIKINVGPVIDPVEKVEVVYITDNLQTTGLIDRWAFAELGKQFNQLLKGKDQQYCLLEPADGNYIYVYCDNTEFELLKNNDYVHKDYMDIFE